MRINRKMRKLRYYMWWKRGRYCCWTSNNIYYLFCWNIKYYYWWCLWSWYWWRSTKRSRRRRSRKLCNIISMCSCLLWLCFCFICCIGLCSELSFIWNLNRFDLDQRDPTRDPRGGPATEPTSDSTKSQHMI